MGKKKKKSSIFLIDCISFANLTVNFNIYCKFIFPKHEGLWECGKHVQFQKTIQVVKHWIPYIFIYWHKSSLKGNFGILQKWAFWLYILVWKWFTSIKVFGIGSVNILSQWLWNNCQQRIKLWPLQPCDSYLLRLLTGPFLKTLGNMSHSHIQMHKHKAPSLKTQGFPNTYHQCTCCGTVSCLMRNSIQLSSYVCSHFTNLILVVYNQNGDKRNQVSYRA